MPRERRKPKGAGRASERWGIVVRLANGAGGYYYLDPTQVDARGIPLERWGRESQAQAFASEVEARRLADTFETNSAAKEYLVLRLGPAGAGHGRPGRSSDQWV